MSASLYKPEYAKQARKLCLLGATDEGLADFFEVDRNTVINWRNAHPAFAEACREGKEVADSRVAASLYQRALGYRHKAVKIFYDPKNGIIEAPYVERYAPDTTACIWWLKNRAPEQWRDRPPEVPTDPGTQANELREALREMDEADGE